MPRQLQFNSWLEGRHSKLLIFPQIRVNKVTTLRRHYHPPHRKRDLSIIGQMWTTIQTARNSPLPSGWRRGRERLLLWKWRTPRRSAERFSGNRLQQWRRKQQIKGSSNRKWRMMEKGVWWTARLPPSVTTAITMSLKSAIAPRPVIAETPSVPAKMT